jgi:hypothetical protein
MVAKLKGKVRKGKERRGKEKRAKERGIGIAEDNT